MRFLKAIIAVMMICVITGCGDNVNEKETEEIIHGMYHENLRIEGDYDEDLAAKCENGIFVGKENEDVISFKGIPYAQQPVGNRRWKVAEPCNKSNDVYEAFYYGKSPIQTKTDSERASYYEQGEDCLNLNIWVNRKNEKTKKPVMVFIHGGSYGWGGTSDPLYDGHNLVKEYDDIILVTVGYRTGIMGFIDLSSVEGSEGYEKSGNLGLLDQVQALKWINKNIEAFGGDPGNVTVFGESAGGGSVSLLPLIDDAKGLFKRVIAQSGSIALTFAKDECQNLTNMLLKESDAKNMKELLALSEDKIRKINEALNDHNIFPVRDGIVLPTDLYKAYEDGAGAGVDMMIGTNSDETRYWIHEVGGFEIYNIAFPIMLENNMKRVSESDRRMVSAFMALQNNKKIWNISEFYDEMMFRLPAIAQASSHADNGGKTFMYYWTYPSAIKHMGACHAVELAYVFNNLNETIYTGNNINRKLAKQTQDAWVNFARTGNPSTKELSWPLYTTHDRKTMELGNESKVVSKPMNEQRILLNNLLKYHFNGNYADLSFNVPFVYKWVSIIVAAIAVLVGTVAFYLKGNAITD